MTKMPPPPDGYRRSGEDQVNGTAERIEHENEFRDWVIARLDEIYRKLNPTPKSPKSDL